ncbi:Multidrug resistance-associated protein 4 [Parelaphostrongylus tenuis]|uniref:Multidrug resistance-associated protein 4 n=1 Tax=Parelaphostrongylus tenuis TaxID=148309 RepID=A0AAD5QIR0_PARTN|nr:Multidrug resistance-associated protein 4 [Parelaphostrongylus tenuis]
MNFGIFNNYVALQVLVAVLIIDSFILFILPFIEVFSNGLLPSAVDFVYPLMLFVAMTLHAIFTFFFCRCGKLTSAGLFLSWLFFTVCGLPEMLYWLYYKSDLQKSCSTDVIRRVAHLLWWPVCFIELVLHCFADTPPVSYKVLNNKGVPSPEIFSSFINRLTTWWFNDICRKGIKKPLEPKDLYALNDDDSSVVLVPKWNELWEKKVDEYNSQCSACGSHIGTLYNGSHTHTTTDSETALLLNEDELRNNVDSENDPLQSVSPNRKRPSIIWCLFTLFKWDIITAMFTKALSDLLQFCNPLLLRSLIRFTENSQNPLWYGIFLALTMFGTSELSSLMQSHYYYLMYRVGTRVQTCLTAAVYRKTLRLSNTARRTKTVGEIVNLMSIDVDRFQQISPNTMQYWSNPLQIILALFFLFHQIGLPVVSGVAIMLMLFPINFLITMLIRKCQLQQMRYKDERTKMVNEVLNGMKVIKLYAWEPAMEHVITDLREKELALIRRAALLRTLSDIFNSASPFLVALFTFTTFLLIDPANVLTPEIAFVSLTLFNQLRTPMSQIAQIITQTVQIVVSNRRLTDFLLSDELSHDCIDTKATDNSEVVKVSNATLTWDKVQNEPIVHNVSFNVKKGQLVCIVGRVGHGKSSFLQALLGEMDKLHGYIGLRGRVSYVPQQPWMQNQTIRQNIIFGKAYNEYFYNRVIDACALFLDLSILPHGDMTEIGEKGINLSGGQKARISLARAVYQNYDVYLLDDPMSAVDSHVASHLFSSVIGPHGMLRNKTRILVTNELSFLKHSDHIYVLENGRIDREGTYNELMQSGALEPLLEECETEEVQKRKMEEHEGESEEDEVYVEVPEYEDSLEKIPYHRRGLFWAHQARPQ